MARKLTPAEGAALTALGNKINSIVQAATVNRLTATNLLASQPTGPHDYADFHRWFQLLYRNLQDLIAAGRVVIEPDLPKSVEANTATPQEGSTAEVTLELRPECLVNDLPTKLTERAITVLHELAHTISEPPEFPVKDFAYRKSWAFSYLPGPVGWRNADTYAEAAAQIAEGLDNAPGRYRERDKLAAQRQALHNLMPPMALGPALAWAEVMINRAWLRGLDFSAHAQIVVGSLQWADTLARWQVPGQGKAALVTIEAALNGWGVASDRTGTLRVDLDAASKATAADIYVYLTNVKNALGSLTLRLSDLGQAIAYNDGTKVLDVPRVQAGGPVSALGLRIISALADGVAYPNTKDPHLAAINVHKLDIVRLLYSNDRAYEGGQVQLITQSPLLTAAAGVPAQAAWDAAKVAVDLAQARGYAEVLEVAMARVTEMLAQAPTAAATLEALDKSADGIRAPLADVVQVGQRLRNTPAANAARIAVFTRILTALQLLQQTVFPHALTQGQAFNPLMASVDPLTQ